MLNLTKITEKSHDVILDLRYATTNNVCGKKLYFDSTCYLHPNAVEALSRAVTAAKNRGLKLKIFDGFRPLEVQKFMFDAFPSSDPNDGFVSNPDGGVTPHCRGVAVDLTLCDAEGNELEMGTDFDEFSDLAFHNCQKISAAAQKNRLLLLDLMTSAGWDFYSKEWWHYQLFNPRDYEIIKTPQNFVAI